MSSLVARRVMSVAKKEVRHILRDSTTLLFALLIPVGQLMLLGYAIDANVRDIRTVVLDQARTQESRALVRSFINSGVFVVIGESESDDDLNRALVGGKARVGIKIPENYSRRLFSGRGAEILVLVDGSDSGVASQAVNVCNSLALLESWKRVLGNRNQPVEIRPRVLFNPDTRSPNFFIPGLLVLICQGMGLLFVSNAIVREKENGTLEQLFMTPVQASELALGKLLPYLGLTALEFLGVLALMRFVFGVPIHGRLTVLLAIALPFVLTMLGLGLWISTKASTRDTSQQICLGVVLPTAFLSGYVFPLDSMPVAFQYLARAIPTTWMIDAARGVIIRGAGWPELQSHAAALWTMAAAALLLGLCQFRKRIA
jgi:ABC-2 type transport system permease protein